MRRGILGSQLDRLAEVLPGFVVLPLLLPGVAPIQMGVGVLGIERDGLGEVGHRLFVLPLVVPDQPAIDEGQRLGAVQLDGLVEILDCLVGIALQEIGVAADEPGPGVLRLQLDQAVEIGQGFVELLGGLPTDPPGVIAGRLRRIERNGQGLIPDRTGVVAGVMLGLRRARSRPPSW